MFPPYLQPLDKEKWFCFICVSSSPFFPLSHPSSNYGPHHQEHAPLGVAEMHSQQIERKREDRKHLVKEAALICIVQMMGRKERKKENEKENLLQPGLEKKHFERKMRGY